ncbi:MAG: peptide chain release factor N(5)-glutamine methyltransferase, partial [Treponema sp.]|nr:peptide chain release factor N(5)-glutamine methyltransferase [Treponema sp.]
MNIREALAEGGGALAAAGIESAGLDASLLLAEVLGVSRSSLIAAGSDPLAETSIAAFRGLIERRLAGECAAYIIGRKEFYGLEFLVTPAVLVPRPDTETLVETAMEVISGQWVVNSESCGSKNRATSDNQPLRVLDLCTGSGAVAIALKHTMPELEVWASDISAEALEVAKTNAARLLSPESIHFCHGDLFEALPNTDNKQHSPLPTPYSPVPSPQSPVPLILSNPPYIPTAEIAGLSAEVR